MSRSLVCLLLILVFCMTGCNDPVLGDVNNSANEQSSHAAMTASDATVLINRYISEITDKDNWLFGKSAEGVTERTVDGLWEKAKAQIFDTSNIGDFLFQNSKINHILFLGEIYINDVDKDGVYEIINLAGWGSGIFRYDLVIYKDGEVFARNCLVPDEGYAPLTLELGSDGNLIFRGYKVNSGETELTDNYGKLVLRMENGVLKPEPEELDGFPFTECGGSIR